MKQTTKDQPRLLSLAYPLTPDSGRWVRQLIELPPNLGLMHLEMIVDAINLQTMLTADLPGPQFVTRLAKDTALTAKKPRKKATHG